MISYKSSLKNYTRRNTKKSGKTILYHLKFLKIQNFIKIMKLISTSSSNCYKKVKQNSGISLYFMISFQNYLKSN